MIRSLTNLSIRKKQMLVLMLTSVIVLLFSSLGFLINDWYSLRGASFERLRAQAAIIGNSSVSAMVFNDNQSAERTLSLLESETDVKAAALFDTKGKIFAQYESIPGTLTQLNRLPEESTGELGDSIYVKHPIDFDGETIGHTLIVADFSDWTEVQLGNLYAAFGVFLLSLIVAYVLSTHLQRIVATPILKLAKMARRITGEQDYSLRAEKSSDDEIGHLVDDFNSMLTQIESRDLALFHANEHLEERIRKRTTELTELTKQLEHQAYHDSLTGLANRVTFDHNLRTAIEQKSRHGGQLAVIFLDLDRFKIINDTLGHAFGDKLLIEVASRFQHCVRSGDTLARLGGDEFALLMFDIEHNNSIMAVATKLAETLSRPLHMEGHELSISTSIGISVYPDDGMTAEDLIKNADTAMYRSKESGRNQITFFSPEMNVRTERRLALESKLRDAFRNNALEIHYQPRFDVQTLKIVGVEALLRWFDPIEGEISPDEFVPVAEDCGLIASIDEWVLQSSCRDILTINNSLPEDAQISLAVNISPAQFIRTDIDEVVTGIIAETQFPSHLLELEVTESLFGPGNTNIYSTFDKLKAQHIKISVDDFGTAYSSLSRLKQLPLHTLKIDKSFIQDIGQDVDDEIITQTIISMAQSLNLHVVAEGVENEDQHSFLKRHGCDSMQGFLFGKPMPLGELNTLLSQSDAQVGVQ